MPWIDKKIRHKCQVPSAQTAFDMGVMCGATYECDDEECSKIYRLDSTSRDGFYWSEVVPEERVIES